jgi:hypothetical protein
VARRGPDTATATAPGYLPHKERVRAETVQRIGEELWDAIKEALSEKRNEEGETIGSTVPDALGGDDEARRPSPGGSPGEERR